MIVIDGIIEGTRTLKDGSIKVIFATQEITPQKAGKLYELSNKYCVVAIKSQGFSDEELKAIENADIDFQAKGKTLSQQLRSVLFINFEQNNEGFETFDRFYQFQMNQFIDNRKSKLE